MPKPLILVTGATGKTGAAVVEQLIAKDYPVRAAVRVRDGRSEALARRGAEVVVADLFDPDQLHDALRGVQRAYYLPPIHPTKSTARRGRNFCRARTWRRSRQGSSATASGS